MNELKKIQIEIKNNYIKCIAIFILLTILNIIIKSNSISYLIASIEVVLLFLIIKKIIRLKKDYRKLYKNIFVVKSLESKFTNLIYNPTEGISYEAISATNMINMGDIYSSEDYISARYKNIKFEQSDVYIKKEHEKVDKNGNSRIEYITIFSGRWMIFDFNKEFKSNIQIIPKDFSDSKQNKVFRKKDELLKKISMESENFNSKFNIFAQNEHEAFYIITPTLMEKIEKLSDKNKGKLLMCFMNNKLHIGLYDNKNAFEPESILKPINEEEIINTIFKDIEAITQFVDELNLDNSLFKKEV